MVDPKGIHRDDDGEALRAVIRELPAGGAL
jgi:hypothetical protein